MTMADYQKNIVTYFTETIQVIVATIVAEHLFTVREAANRELMDEEQAYNKYT